MTFSSCRLLLVLLWSISCTPAFAENESGKANLLVIMTDQLRFDAIGAAGNTLIKTPNLDRLARSGVIFERAYTPVPVCAPARTSILTGQSTQFTAVSENRTAFDEGVFKGGKSYDMHLAEAGYRTAFYGKWHSPMQLAKVYENLPESPLTPTTGRFSGWPSMEQNYVGYLKAEGYPKLSTKTQNELPNGQLVDTFSKRPYQPSIMDARYELTSEQLQSADRPSQGMIQGTLQLDAAHSITALQARELMAAIDRFAKEPFSLTVSFHYPHPPYTPTEPYASMYAAEDMKLSSNFDDRMVRSPYLRSNKRSDLPQYRDEKKVRQFIATYYGLVTEIDDWVGRILDLLEQHELTEKTMIIFVSDHGEMLGSHGMTGKNIFYEESARVPFFISYPGEISAGTRITNAVSTRDIFPTVMDYLGQPFSQNLNSQSLRRVIEGKEQRDVVVAEWRDATRIPNFMAVSGNWKLLISKFPDSGSVDALYDLEADPGEVHNLLFDGMSARHARVAQDMKSRLLTWLETNAPASVAGVKARQLPSPATDP